MLATEPTKPRRIDLILRQIDSLPTLPAIAARLLSLTSSDESHAKQVIDLVGADPALSAKVLSLCRTADKGLAGQGLTIDRAVVLLGFNAIRNAVLSVKVFEAFGPHADRPEGATAIPDDTKGFDRSAFWLHSLAVGVAAEQIARAHPDRLEFEPDEAFVCGLLHDVGKIALDFVLPKSFARVVELTDLNQANIAEYERRVIGIDHHTAGKRLAQQWGLPHMIADCIWLHGSPFDTLPKLDHREMIGLISLADLIARRMHAGYSGNYSQRVEVGELAQKLGLNPQAVADVADNLHETLKARAEVLGLFEESSNELLLDAVQRANQALGRINAVLDRQGKDARGAGEGAGRDHRFQCFRLAGQECAGRAGLGRRFLRQAAWPGFYGAIYPGPPVMGDSGGYDGNDGWLLCQYNEQGHPCTANTSRPRHTPRTSASWTRPSRWACN